MSAFNTILSPANAGGYGATAERMKAIAEKLDAAGVPYAIDHEHRAWEYGLTLDALKANGCASLLDVGSGSSLLPVLAAQDGCEVAALDADARVLNAVARAVLAVLAGASVVACWHPFEDFEPWRAFDAVSAVSVLEHVADDEAFLRKCLAIAQKLVVLTVDYWPDGSVRTHWHRRTYGPDGLNRLVQVAKQAGWEPADTPTWPADGVQPLVGGADGYTFAALVLKRTPKPAPSPVVAAVPVTQPVPIPAPTPTPTPAPVPVPSEATDVNRA